MIYIIINNFISLYFLERCYFKKILEKFLFFLHLNYNIYKFNIKNKYNMK